MRITIYCSDYGLKLLAQATKIGGDGTFKTRPKIYQQLYIIMAWHKGVCQPAAFCLLGGKHGDTYIRMIYEINKGIIALGLTWKPEFVSLDFEMGAILAFIFCFPAIKIIGCWFHFGQCLFRKILEIGLKTQYGDDEELKKLVQNCISLALCHPDEVVDIFVSHVINKSVPIQRKYPRFDEFIKYMTKTWIEGEGESGPLFKIEWWNHWKHLETRTNITNEAYNFRLTVKMGSQIHPNIWLWVEFIQEEDFQLSVKYEQIKNDTYKGRNRTNEVRKDNQILNAKVKYLESIKDSKAIDDFLTLLREICPKPTF